MPGATGWAKLKVAVWASASTDTLASRAAPPPAGARVARENFRSAAFRVMLLVGLATVTVMTALALKLDVAAFGVSEIS